MSSDSTKSASETGHDDQIGQAYNNNLNNDQITDGINTNNDIRTPGEPNGQSVAPVDLNLGIEAYTSFRDDGTLLMTVPANTLQVFDKRLNYLTHGLDLLAEAVAKLSSSEGSAKRVRVNEDISHNDSRPRKTPVASTSNFKWTVVDKKHAFKPKKPLIGTSGANRNPFDFSLEMDVAEHSDEHDELDEHNEPNKDNNPQSKTQPGHNLESASANNTNKNDKNSNNKNLELNFPGIRPIKVKKNKGRRKEQGAQKPPTTSSAAPKKSKLPPIIATLFDVKDFVKALKDLNFSNYRYNVNLNSGRITIYTGDRATFDTVLTILRGNKLQFFTQAPAEERRTNLILKGVPTVFDIEDVKADINSFGLGEGVKVVPLKEGNKGSFNYFILSLANGIDPKPLIGEHRLFHTTVRIQKYNRNSIPQCYKCAQLGHFQQYCGFDPFCHKCGLSHDDPKQCTVQADSPAEQKYCRLCEKYGHTSSYKGCPTYKQALLRSKEAKANKVKPVAREVSRLVTSNLSFSAVASSRNNTGSKGVGPGGYGTGGSVPITNPSNVSLSSAKSFLDEACLESFGCSFDQFQQKFAIFQNSYRKAVGIEAKRTLLFNFLSVP